MNARQAAKAAAKRIEELEYFNQRASADIKRYNEVIGAMINHASPCQFCEDLEECRAAGKDTAIGCDDWMLSFEE